VAYGRKSLVPEIIHVVPHVIHGHVQKQGCPEQHGEDFKGAVHGIILSKVPLIFENYTLLTI
jgi:hypothetical protein